MAAKRSLPAGIVRAAIHPSIGIARIGNSEAEWFYGPEVTDPLPHPPGSYRDKTGALKRQAARFRVYGLDAKGRAVAELTAADADITWTVHLANRKAAWYEFQLAQDIPEAASAPKQMLRNITVADRASLTIDPGSRQITGKNVHGGPDHTFDTGRFLGTPVYLGEIGTDEDGRLVVLGGRGKSASHDGTPAGDFANNNGWHDDASDGPVTAEVIVGDTKLAVDPAWIVVAPPNYAPMRKSVRTMWDLMRDVAIVAGQLKAPDRPSFQHDIRPMFERLAGMQWVNEGFAAYFGWRAPNDLVTDEWLARLSSPGAEEAETRHIIASQFRRPDRDAWSPVPWPWMYGDAMSIPTPHTSNAFASLTATQLAMLDQWADGKFDNDYKPGWEPPRHIEDVPLVDQPHMLDRASLEFCLADAFHPGCEMTWPMRHWTMYMAPFRIRHATDTTADPSYGTAFTPDLIALPDGPLFGQIPGGITRWMAVPWQTDTASCRSGYGPPSIYAPHLPTFWPARVPNQVLTPDDYDTVIDTHKPLGKRLKAFAQRSDWIWPANTTDEYLEQINRFVAVFGQMSVVETREGPHNDANFPPVMEIADRPLPKIDKPAALVAERADISSIAKVRRFPYGLKQLA